MKRTTLHGRPPHLRVPPFKKSEIFLQFVAVECFTVLIAYGLWLQSRDSPCRKSVAKRNPKTCNVATRTLTGCSALHEDDSSHCNCFLGGFSKLFIRNFIVFFNDFSKAEGFFKFYIRIFGGFRMGFCNFEKGFSIFVRIMECRKCFGFSLRLQGATLFYYFIRTSDESFLIEMDFIKSWEVIFNIFIY